MTKRYAAFVLCSSALIFSVGQSAIAGPIIINSNLGTRSFQEGQSWSISVDADLVQNDAGEWLLGYARDTRVSDLNASVTVIGGWWDSFFLRSRGTQDGFLNFRFNFFDDGRGGAVTGQAAVGDWIPTRSRNVEYWQSFSTKFDFIVNNVAPTITSITSDIITDVGSSFNFAALATDPGRYDILSYMWDLDGDGEYDDAIGNTGSHIYSRAGTHTASVRVTDGDGGIATRSFSVQANALVAVPEPGTLALLGLGLIGLGAVRRRYDRA